MKSRQIGGLRMWGLGTSITFLLFLQWFHLTEEAMQPVSASAPRYETIHPDFHRCHKGYGTDLSLDSCRRALAQLPTRGDREGYMDFFQEIHNYDPVHRRPKYHLPLHLVDPHFATSSSAPHARPCSIILQAEPWPAEDFDFETFSAPELRLMIEEVLRDCVGQNHSGGFVTYGLFETLLYFFEHFARQEPAPFITITVTNSPFRPEPGTNDPTVPSAIREELQGYYGTRYHENEYIVDDMTIKTAQLRLRQTAKSMRVGGPISWVRGVYPLPRAVIVSGHMGD